MRYVLLIMVGLIWGSQYVLNDIILENFSPLGLTALRLFFGFITLSLLIFLIPSQRKQQLPLTPKLFKLLLLVGATEAAIPFSLIAFGQTQISASMAAIILGIIPIMTLLLHTYVVKTHTLRLIEVIGMLIAFIGLVVLVNPSSESVIGTFWGYGALFVAALSFAISFIFMDKIPHNISALHASRFILFIYSIPFMMLWALTREGPVSTNIGDWASIILLGALASGFIYVLYIKLVRLAGPTFTSLSNYIVPLVGTFLSTIILHEPLTNNIIIALFLITFSLFII